MKAQLEHWEEDENNWPVTFNAWSHVVNEKNRDFFFFFFVCSYKNILTRLKIYIYRFLGLLKGWGVLFISKKFSLQEIQKSPTVGKHAYVRQLSVEVNAQADERWHDVGNERKLVQILTLHWLLYYIKHSVKVPDGCDKQNVVHRKKLRILTPYLKVKDSNCLYFHWNFIRLLPKTKMHYSVYIKGAVVCIFHVHSGTL